MKKHIGFSLIFLLGFVFSARANENTITISGTGDSQDLLRAVASAFMIKNPDTQIIVPESIGSSGGVKATAKGLCELGRIARPLKPSEDEYKLNYKLFAFSPVVFVTNSHQKNVKNITIDQLLDVYSGKITNWSQLGGVDGKIFIANREGGDSSLSILEKTLPGFKAIAPYAGEVLYSTPVTAQTIATINNTIGYLPLAMAETYNLNVISIDGIEPNMKNVQTGKYPYFLRFGIIWKGQITPLAKRFLDFLLSDEGGKIIIKNGAFPAK